MQNSKNKNRRAQLTRLQLDFLDDLFAGDSEEQAVLEKHGISRSRYSKWLTQERFTKEYDLRTVSAEQQSRSIVARTRLQEARKTAQRIQRKIEEMDQQACLDLVGLQSPALPQTPPDAPPAPEAPAPPSQDLSPETASRLLAALAHEERQGTT